MDSVLVKICNSHQSWDVYLRCTRTEFGLFFQKLSFEIHQLIHSMQIFKLYKTRFTSSQRLV